MFKLLRQISPSSLHHRINRTPTTIMSAATLSAHAHTNGDQAANAPEQLRFSKLTDQAFAPTRGSARAAGCDLRSAYDYTVAPGGKAICLTDLAIEVPAGCYGRVAPRSGLAAKHHIDVGAGVIDEDYRGNVGVVLFNHAGEPFEVKRGDRIAQLVCERCVLAEPVEATGGLDETARGAGGFGSTGRN